MLANKNVTGYIYLIYGMRLNVTECRCPFQGMLRNVQEEIMECYEVISN